MRLGDDAGSGEEDGGAGACASDGDCDDQLFCNGVERCVDGVCAPAEAMPCAGRTCDEPSQRCDCHGDRDNIAAWFCGGADDDADGDNVIAAERGGNDCDDLDGDRFPGNIEVCDIRGHDEDCNLDTVGTADGDDPPSDRDGDGYVGSRCINIDHDTGQVHRDALADCDDTIPEIHPGPDSQDFCDGYDNDCDGFTDEREGEHIDRGAQQFYCRDADNDGWSVRKDPVQRCGAPPGYVLCDAEQPADCKDDDPRIHPSASEQCNGHDDDCDDRVDLPSGELTQLSDAVIFGDETTAVCRDGDWAITECPSNRLWCETSTIAHGCETDATRLSTCRSCGPTGCHFACGDTGCDDIEQLALGTFHACARTREGRVACWGRGAKGNLGNDSTASSTLPTPVELIQNAATIAAGADHTCAVVGAEHVLYCWGSNASGQLGTTETDDLDPQTEDFSAVPLQVLGFEGPRLNDVSEIAAGAQHTCAVLGTGQLLCWGVTLDSGVVEQGAAYPKEVVGPGGSEAVIDARRVAVGAQHACYLDEQGGVACWGDNTFGQLGDAKAETSRFHAEPVAGVREASALVAGDNHTCALAQKRVYCWGANGQGQLGHASDSSDATAQPISALDDVVELAAGDELTCAVTSKGALSCWGSNWFGERGDKNIELSSFEPTRVPLERVVKVDAGTHVCAISATTGTSCWGANFHGQLGAGTRSDDPEYVPQVVGALTTSKP